MIFPFCSVYSTYRCPFSLQSYCPGEWSSTAMLTGRGLNDSFPQIKDLGISLTPLSVSLPYRPHSAVF